jgi:SPP1 gp7 family putative phage head morphogenesis protein
MRALELAIRQMALIGRTPKRNKRPRAVTARFPSAARVAYLRGILDILAIVEATVRRDVMPLLPVILGQHKILRPDATELRVDDTGSLTEKSLSDVRKDLERRIPERQIQMLAQENALRVSEHSRGELERQIRAVAKIDLFDHPAGLAQHIDAFIADNVRLVKSVAFDQLEDLKGIILRGARLGHRHEEVAKEIQERFGISKRRAALIATDQVASLNGELAQLRQQQVGIKHYTWSTSQDERVRKSHRAMNDTHQRWDKPPMVDGVPAHPGQPIRCRCQAIPDVDDVLREAGLLAPEPSVPPPAGKPALKSVPPPSQPPEGAAEVPAWMTGTIDPTEAKPIGDGLNGAELVTWRGADGKARQGVWKSVDKERPDLRDGVKAGTYHEREAALYELDQLLGGESAVPATVSRRVKGKQGSMQRFVPGEKTYKIKDELEVDAHITEDPTVRKMFLLDAIAANDDRHGENALWRKERGRFKVAAIDNGLTFPEGRPERFLFALPTDEFAHAMMELDPTSIRQLRSLDLSKVAAILHRRPGITEQQIRETLSRIRSLQYDPQQLLRTFGKGGSRWSWAGEFMRDWLGIAPERRLGLTSADHAEIGRLSKRRTP